jgi:hypothetical protein
LTDTGKTKLQKLVENHPYSVFAFVCGNKEIFLYSRYPSKPPSPEDTVYHILLEYFKDETRKRMKESGYMTSVSQVIDNILLAVNTRLPLIEEASGKQYDILDLHMPYLLKLIGQELKID